MVEQIAVPSGQDITLIDVIHDAEGAVRFRFLAPAIASKVDFDTAVVDMQVLCETYALPKAGGASQIIVSLADSVFPFGETMPDAVQYFEAFNVTEGRCILDPYLEEY